MKKPVQGPEPRWSKQISRMKLFDQLIGNIDRNQGNLIYDADWHLFLIDHSRAFTSRKSLDGIAVPGVIDAEYWKRIEALTPEAVEARAGQVAVEGRAGGDLRPPRAHGAGDHEAGQGEGRRAASSWSNAEIVVRRVTALLAAAAAIVVAGAAAVAQPRPEGRIVAIGDVHGSLSGLVGILKATGLIDDAGHWAGGTDHLRADRRPHRPRRRGARRARPDDGPRRRGAEGRRPGRAGARQPRGHEPARRPARRHPGRSARRSPTPTRRRPATAPGASTNS